MKNKFADDMDSVTSPLDKKAEVAVRVLDDIDDKIVTTLEATRVNYGLSYAHFAKLLGLSFDQYYKRTHHYKKKFSSGEVLPTRNKFTAAELVRFCYVFGFDLETIVQTDKAVLFSSEQAIHELALQFASLNDDVLEEIQSTISASKNLSQGEKHSCTNALRSYIGYRKEMLARLSLYNSEEEDFDDIDYAAREEISDEVLARREAAKRRALEEESRRDNGES